MNKKGFTLVELLAVIALLALLTGLAVPNIISTINNNKRNTFLMDAERMVTKAKYLISINKVDRKNVLAGNNKIYNLNDLNEKGEFETDADGGSYESVSVIVSYDNTNKVYKYCIQVVGSKRVIGKTSCIDSESLTGIDVVKDK